VTDADLQCYVDANEERKRLKEASDQGPWCEVYDGDIDDTFGRPIAFGIVEANRRFVVHARNDPVEQQVDELIAEVKRLRWRLNHQTEDDAWECANGKHRDCGK